MTDEERATESDRKRARDTEREGEIKAAEGRIEREEGSRGRQ